MYLKLKLIVMSDGKRKISCIPETPEQTKERRRIHKEIETKISDRIREDDFPPEIFAPSQEEILKEKFLQYINRKGEDGCWIWTGKIEDDGYGYFDCNGKSELVHIVSYMIFKGAIPESKKICHKCDNEYCCNPNHMFACSS